eukprot:4627774-Pyramimonas_sp.AAC.1
MKGPWFSICGSCRSAAQFLFQVPNSHKDGGVVFKMLASASCTLVSTVPSDCKDVGQIVVKRRQSLETSLRALLP